MNHSPDEHYLSEFNHKITLGSAYGRGLMAEAIASSFRKCIPPRFITTGYPIELISFLLQAPEVVRQTADMGINSILT